MFGVIRPAVARIMLTAAVNMRIEQQHRPAVLQARGFVVTVAQYHIRSGKIMQRLEVRRKCRGQRIERYIFASVRPFRVTGNRKQNLV